MSLALLLVFFLNGNPQMWEPKIRTGRWLFELTDHSAPRFL